VTSVRRHSPIRPLVQIASLTTAAAFLSAFVVSSGPSAGAGVFPIEAGTYRACYQNVAPSATVSEPINFCRVATFRRSGQGYSVTETMQMSGRSSLLLRSEWRVFPINDPANAEQAGRYIAYVRTGDDEHWYVRAVVVPGYGEALFHVTDPRCQGLTDVARADLVRSGDITGVDDTRGANEIACLAANDARSVERVIAAIEARPDWPQWAYAYRQCRTLLGVGCS
jgi:hypothetical protein